MKYVKLTFIPVVILMLLILASGCSSGGIQSPLNPASHEKAASGTGSHYTWGLW